MIAIILSFLVAMIMLYVVVYTAGVHAKLSLDHDLDGVQKMHEFPVPRVGGLAIFVSMTFTALYGANTNAPWAPFYSGVIAALFFVFVGGLTEDLSKAVSPRVRIGFMSVGVAYAIFIAHCIPLLRYVANPSIETVLQFDVVAIVVTWFMVIGLANAYNIIDGFNGLSSTSAIVNAAGLAFLGWRLGDTFFIVVALSFLVAVIAFFLFNYPKAKIFLGDGGSYSVGFIIALLSLNISAYHRTEVSPYAPLLLAVYPITEMLVTILRRKFVHKTKASQPDSLHLHQLVYDRCLPGHFSKTKRNYMVMPMMLMFILPQLILVMFFYNNHTVMVGGLIGYVAYYLYFYVRLIKFKTPKFMIIRSNAPKSA